MTRTATTRLARALGTLAAAALAITSLAAVTGDGAGASPSPAVSLARQLLNEAVLPPSAVLVHPSTVVVCQCEGAPSGGPTTSLHRYYIVAGAPASIESYLSSHVPTGAVYGGGGTTQTRGAAEILSTAIIFPSNGPHLYLKQLAYSMTTRTASTSWLRVDSEVVWIPNRSAAQEVTGVVSATATGYQTTGLMGSTGAAAVQLDGTQLADFVHVVNQLPLAPRIVCMENVNAFQVTLRLNDGDSLHIYNGNCNGLYETVSRMSGDIAVGGFTLSDRSCALIAVVSGLFPPASARGTHQALRDCEVSKKSGA
jgi:hypothetical protein